MERLPAVSLCRFGFEVVPDADGVRQRPADQDAKPDARDPQRRSREQMCWMKRPMERVMKNEAPGTTDRKSTRLNSSHVKRSRMPSSA